MLLRDFLSESDPQILALGEIVEEISPDVLVLADVDFDLEGVVAKELARLTRFPHQLALRPNRGIATGLDLNRDGRLGTAEDAQGYGHFAGQGGMVVLSRHPIDRAGVQDFSEFLWLDLDGQIAPEGTLPEQRLGTTGHWVIPIEAEIGKAILVSPAAKLI